MYMTVGATAVLPVFHFSKYARGSVLLPPASVCVRTGLHFFAYECAGILIGFVFERVRTGFGAAASCVCASVSICTCLPLNVQVF